MKSLLLCLALSLSAFGQGASPTSADIKNDTRAASKPTPLEFNIFYFEGPGAGLALSSYLFTAPAHRRTHYVGEVPLDREGWIYGLYEVDHSSIDQKNVQIPFSNSTLEDNNLQ